MRTPEVSPEWQPCMCVPVDLGAHADHVYSRYAPRSVLCIRRLVSAASPGIRSGAQCFCSASRCAPALRLSAPRVFLSPRVLLSPRSAPAYTPASTVRHPVCSLRHRQATSRSLNCPSCDMRQIANILHLRSLRLRTIGQKMVPLSTGSSPTA